MATKRILVCTLAALSAVCSVQGFAPGILPIRSPISLPIRSHISTSASTRLHFSNNNPNSESNDTLDNTSLSTSDQQALGVAGTLAALIVLVSEYTLFSTGCGLPAGPLGIYGLLEGLSYLGVVGVGGYSAVTKFQTGSGLPAGPLGLLGAAEGLSFLAIGAGLLVLVSQVTNYGYIPNAVPMEGGMCS